MSTTHHVAKTTRTTSARPTARVKHAKRVDRLNYHATASKGKTLSAGQAVGPGTKRVHRLDHSAAATTPNTLSAGQTLGPGAYLLSPNQQYELLMQTDGNLVLYHGSTVLWSSGTAGDNGATATMQGDGNLVIYENGVAKWHTHTWGFPGATLVLQDDSNLVVYHSGHPIWDWSAGYVGDRLNGWTLGPGAYLLSPNHQYELIMRTDGDLILGQTASSTVLWASHTAGDNGAIATMQGDGNLVIYENGVAKWNTHTWGFRGADLVLQDDNRLVIYSAAGSPVWVARPFWANVFYANAISYDTADAQITGTSLADLYTVAHSNGTAVTQSTTISGSQVVTDTAGWSDTQGVKVNASAGLNTGIPGIVGGTITVSVEGSLTFTQNGSTSIARTFSWQQPLIVPPHSTVVATVAVTRSTLTVPYTLSGNYCGTAITTVMCFPGPDSGMYSGINSHDLKVTLTQLNLDGSRAAHPVRQPRPKLLKVS